MLTDSEIFHPDWCDLVFSSRNKSYGAYVLRKEHNRNLLLGLMVSLGLFASLSIASGIHFLHAPIQKVPRENDDGILNITDVNLGTKILMPPPAPSPVPAPRVDNLNYVVKKYPIPEPMIETGPNDGELHNPVAGAGTSKAEGTGNNVISPPIPGPDDTVYPSYGLQKVPQFPGGMDAMMAFLTAHMVYPQLAKEAGITGTVFVSFVINKAGLVQNIEVSKGIGGGCDQEAMRVISMMPAWSPGKQNDQAVSVRYCIPIRFTLR